MPDFLSSQSARAVPNGHDRHQLCGTIVAHARNPIIFTDLDVSGTTTGRFAVVAPHAFLVMDRLGQVSSHGRVSQALFDVMFAANDRNLREMRVGDLSFGRRVRVLTRRFYAMTAAYRDGLNRGVPVLRDALCDYPYVGKTPARNA